MASPGVNRCEAHFPTHGKGCLWDWPPRVPLHLLGNGCPGLTTPSRACERHVRGSLTAGPENLLAHHILLRPNHKKPTLMHFSTKIPNPACLHPTSGVSSWQRGFLRSVTVSQAASTAWTQQKGFLQSPATATKNTSDFWPEGHDIIISKLQRWPVIQVLLDREKYRTWGGCSEEGLVVSPGWLRVWRNRRTTDSLSEALLILYSSWPPFTHRCTHSCKTHTGTHMCPHTHLHMGMHTWCGWFRMLLAQYGRHEPKCTQPPLSAGGSVERVVFTILLNPRYNPLIWEYLAGPSKQGFLQWIYTILSPRSDPGSALHHPQRPPSLSLTPAPSGPSLPHSRAHETQPRSPCHSRQEAPVSSQTPLSGESLEALAWKCSKILLLPPSPPPPDSFISVLW